MREVAMTNDGDDWDDVRAWVDGASMGLDVIRRRLLEFADQWSEAARSVMSADADVSHAIDRQAATLASMRGDAALPRVVRMHLSERERAYAYLLALLVGHEDETERRQNDHVLLERMLGLRSGHRGGLAGVALLRLVPQELQNLCSVDDMRHAARSASDEELEYVRLVVQLCLEWSPLLVTAAMADYGAKGSAFESLVLRVLDSAPAPMYALMVSSWLPVVCRKAIPSETLRELILSLRPGVADLALLEMLPKSERNGAFDRLSERRRAAIAQELRKRAREDHGSAQAGNGW